MLELKLRLSGIFGKKQKTSKIGLKISKKGPKTKHYRRDHFSTKNITTDFKDCQCSEPRLWDEQIIISPQKRKKRLARTIYHWNMHVFITFTDYVMHSFVMIHSTIAIKDSDLITDDVFFCNLLAETEHVTIITIRVKKKTH